jgi:hypothetical protein
LLERVDHAITEPSENEPNAPATVSDQLERWLQGDGEKTVGRPDRAVPGEELSRSYFVRLLRRPGAAAAVA